MSNRLCVCTCICPDWVTGSGCVKERYIHALIGCRKRYGPLREGMGECVLSTTAINYKALGLHVLIRGINVSSFPPHTPPFASINAAGGRKSMRASESERERERLPCVSYGGGERRQDGKKQGRKKESITSDNMSIRRIGGTMYGQKSLNTPWHKATSIKEQFSQFDIDGHDRSAQSADLNVIQYFLKLQFRMPARPHNSNLWVLLSCRSQMMAVLRFY